MKSRSIPIAAAQTLLPGIIPDGDTGAPEEWAAKAARARAACGRYGRELQAMDREAAKLLVNAPTVPLRGRLVLELVRRAGDVAGTPMPILNALAQVAQRRWQAAGLPVSTTLRSPLDLIGDDEWRGMALADELAALVAQRSRSDGRE